MFRPFAPLVAVFIALFLVHAAPARAQGTCTPGARVAAASYGHWYAATVLRSEGGKCVVKYDKFSSEEAVTRDNIGPMSLANQYDASGAAASGGGQVAATGAPAAARLVPTSYACTSFVGPVTGGGHMVPMPGLTIMANGTYSHANGGGGRVSAGGGVVEFHGGPLDGQAATYDTRSGRGALHIYNERRSRTVIDCDGRR